MFGLQTKSLIVGVLIGWFLLPLILGYVSNFTGSKG